MSSFFFNLPFVSSLFFLYLRVRRVDSFFFFFPNQRAFISIICTWLKLNFMLVKIVLTLVSFRPSFFHTSAHPNEIPHSNNYMSNPAGWKVIYSRLAFTMPLKTVLCYPSRLWPLFTYMFPITLLMHPPPFS